MSLASQLRLKTPGKITAERFLWLGAVLFLGFGALTIFRGALAQRESVQRFPATSSAGATSALLVNTSAPRGPHIEGRLEIPALHLSVPILSECSDSALRLGTCHVQGTAVPGGLGNMGVAGHRDGTFRPLKGIRQGQTIDVIAQNGRFRYIVDTMGIVAADDVSVLAIGEIPQLTLITCFPFNYVGAAPQRFIVHAHLLSVDGFAG